ncbi:MAG: DUF4097 family beta strand repeat protein, partial [Bacteroidales bacterium]
AIHYDPDSPTPKSTYVWTIRIPSGTILRCDGATGNIEINNFRGSANLDAAELELLVMDCIGNFRVSTASGNFSVTNSEGTLNFSSASAKIDFTHVAGSFSISSTSENINAEDIMITDASNFSSNSGDINISLKETLMYDLELKTGSGNAVLDFNGQDIAGSFEFIARADKGKIICPFTFDEELVFQDDLNTYRGEEDFGKQADYIKKRCRVTSDFPEIKMRTVTGTIRVKN